MRFLKMYLWCLIILVSILIIYFYYRKPAGSAGKPLYDWNGVYAGENRKITMTGFPDNAKINLNGMEMSPVFVENNMTSVGLAVFRNGGKTMEVLELGGNKIILNKMEGNTEAVGYFQDPPVEDSPWNGKWLTMDGKTEIEMQKSGGKINYIMQGFIFSKLTINADGSANINGIKMVLNGDKIMAPENGNVVMLTRIGN